MFEKKKKSETARNFMVATTTTTTTTTSTTSTTAYIIDYSGFENVCTGSSADYFSNVIKTQLFNYTRSAFLFLFFFFKRNDIKRFETNNVHR